MNNIEVTTIDLVEGGNVFKQGHHLTLGYIPRDEKGGVVDLSNKTLSVSIWGRIGVVFEGAATFSADTIRFTLKELIPAGEYQVEFTATSSTDSSYRKKFPTNTTSGRITVKQSADDLAATGLSVITVSQFRKEFDAAVAAVTKDSEVVLARKEYTTLGQRLEAEKQELTQQLAEKANQEDVRESTDDRPINVKEFDTETKKLFTGGAVAVVKEDAIGFENLKRKSVKPTRTSFLNSKGNLFNKTEVIPGGYFLSTGVWVANAEFKSTGYIEVDYGRALITNVKTIFSHVAFFDANNAPVTAITAGAWSGIINVPNNPAIYYMAFSFYNAENTDALILVNGTTLPPNYIPYGFVLNDSIDLSDSQLRDVLTKNALEVTTGKNLFDYKTMVLTGKELGVNALERAGANSSVTAPLEVDSAKKTLSVSGLPIYEAGYNRVYSFYDANGSPLKPDISADSIYRLVDNGAIPIPAAAKIFRMNIYSNKTSAEPVDFSAIQIEYGPTVTPLEYFEKTVTKINGFSLKPDDRLVTEDLSVLILGDSISETASISDDGATYTEGTRSNWPTHTQAALNFKTFHNYAKAGAAYRDRTIGTGSDTITSIRQRLSHQIQTAIDNKRPADIIVVACGTNDGTTNMGTYAAAMAKTSLEALDKTYLYDALRWAFWKLRIAYPNATFFATTPLQRTDYEPVNSLNTAIKTMAERYGFIVIDATYQSGIVRDFEVPGGQGRDLYDGLHPSISGQIKQSKLINRIILNTLNDGF